MGADQSRPSMPSSARRRRRKDGEDADDGIGENSLWEAVPREVLWLVQLQVQLLLQKHAGSLLHRPEQLQTQEDDLTLGTQQELQPHEIKMASAALADRKLTPHLQRALHRLVPAQLTEAQFWDNFFSHVDVIKVRIVTDFLSAQDMEEKGRAKRHAEWVAAFDACGLQLQAEPKRAAEYIAEQQRPPTPPTVDSGMGRAQHAQVELPTLTPYPNPLASATAATARHRCLPAGLLGLALLAAGGEPHSGGAAASPAQQLLTAGSPQDRPSHRPPPPPTHRPSLGREPQSLWRLWPPGSSRPSPCCGAPAARRGPSTSSTGRTRSSRSCSARSSSARRKTPPTRSRPSRAAAARAARPSRPPKAAASSRATAASPP